MATHAAIQAAADAYWVSHQQQFVDAQNAYAATHGGRFFQGIITPGTPPDDGALTSPDLTKHPTDQPETWQDVFTGINQLPNNNWPASIRIDVYDGPSGTGWVVSVVYTKNGEIWAKSINVGPETWRNIPWHLVGLVGQIQPLFESSALRPDDDSVESPKGWWQRFKDRVKAFLWRCIEKIIEYRTKK